MLALGSASAFAQTLDDPIGQVTSTVGAVVSTLEETADSSTGGATGGATGGGSSSESGTIPSTESAGSTATNGTSSSGTRKESTKKSNESGRGAAIAATCAEASRDPRSFAAWMATFNEARQGRDAGGRTTPAGGVKGSGASSAAPFAGGAEANLLPDLALPPAPAVPTPGLTGFRDALGILALITIAIGLLTLVATATRFWVGKWSP